MGSIRSYILRYAIRRLTLKARKVDRSVVEQRSAFERMLKQRSIPPSISVEPCSIDSINAEWVKASNAAEDRVILYLHGGAYIMGSINTHRDLASRLSAASGAKVLQIDYRLAPEHPHPAALDDAKSAYSWLVKRGYSPNKIVIAGDSAGGGLALATLISLRDAGIKLPAAALFLSPWIDLMGTGDSFRTMFKKDILLDPDWMLEMAAHYAANQDPSIPSISPLNANLKGLPPLLIHVGGEEILLSD